VILFQDSAPTRGNLVALAILRQRNIMMITLSSPLAHILHRVDVAWVRRFKSQFRDSIRDWREAHPTASFPLPLGQDQGNITPTALTRAQVVGAATDAAHSATLRSVCKAGSSVSSLVDREGGLPQHEPPNSAHVRPSEEDPELDA
jgi:hypothetical protein